MFQNNDNRSCVTITVPFLQPSCFGPLLLKLQNIMITILAPIFIGLLCSILADQSKNCLTFQNVEMNCTYGNMKTCCKNLQHITQGGFHPHLFPRQCTIRRVYIPSKYEMRHLKKAEELLAIPNWSNRRSAFVEFVSSQEEVNAAVIFLGRVKARMQSPHDDIPATVDDELYLSQFQISRHCQDGSNNMSNTVSVHSEWIEPLTVHARHPFSMGQCGAKEKDVEDISRGRMGYPGPSTICDVDYVLTTSASAVLNQSTFCPHRPPRRLLFDAGASTFDSSLNYLTCAYSQRGIYFDAVEGWEFEVMRPVEVGCIYKCNLIPYSYSLHHHQLLAPPPPLATFH